MEVQQVGNNTFERKPIITNAAHCARAIALVKSGDLYYGVGKQTPWDEHEHEQDFVPPAPNIDAENLDELIGLKKAERVALVEPSEEGEIEYAGQRFTTITEEIAMEHKARWVLVQTTIAFEELPPVPYRQTGIFSHVKPKGGVENNDVLLPDEIENIGILEVINNRKVVTRQSDTKDTFRMIIEC